MNNLWNEWLENKSPGHHLWGVTHLDKYGIDVDILPYEKYSLLKKISKKVKLLGDLDQQIRILLTNDRYDLVYSGCQYDTFLLGILRSLGFFQTPLVAIVHHKMKSVLKNKLAFKILYGGHDLFICLNAEVKKQLELEFNIPPEKLHLLEWGVDLDFYPIETIEDDRTDRQAKNNAPYIFSTGRSYRDYDTLVQAFLGQEYHLHLYCTKDSKPTIAESKLSDNIQIKYDYQDKELLSTRELLPEYRKAYAVAIPLQDKKDNLVGLTSLLDAMAMGKPVIMTRNKQLNIDIEKEGIGIWIEPGDVRGWQKAINYLIENPVKAKEMGMRGRYLCERKYNIEIFSRQLGKMLKNLERKTTLFHLPSAFLTGGKH